MSDAIATLRPLPWLAPLDGLWIGRRRRAMAVIFLVIAAIGAVYILATARDFLAFDNKPVGNDFMTFYSAATLALDGHATAPWNPDVLFARQATIMPASEGVYLWHHPPTFLLMMLGFGAVPYGLAIIAFSLFSLALFAASARALLPRGEALLVGLASPIAYLCVMNGQTGILTGVLLTFGYAWLDRRPLLAGVCIGLLAFKPHLAVLAPLLLAASGRWTSFAAAGATVIAFAGASVLAFGMEPWRAFAENLALTSKVLNMEDTLPWARIPSVFIMLREFGAGQDIAYAAHWVAAAGVAGLTAWIWRGDAPPDLKAATGLLAACLIPPYLFDYDLVVLCGAAALMLRAAGSNPLPAGWPTLIALMLLGPFLAPLATAATGAPLFFLATAGAYAALAMIAWPSPAPDADKARAGTRALPQVRRAERV
jgi:hypothetical protein